MTTFAERWAHKRRMRAMERMDRFWTCWYLFFRRLHEESPPWAPLSFAEYRFKEAVDFHRALLR